MLHFIAGVAGSGKTTEVYERIGQTVRAGGHVLLLVPEQFSFESERALAARLGERLALEVQVLSFTRLCHKVFYRYGQVAGNFLDRTGKYLLMSLALDQVCGQLTLYRAQAEKTSFVPVALDMVGEFKNAGITADTVCAASAGCGDTELADKLGELGLVYAAYQALIEDSYRDPSDDMERALALCAGGDFFGGGSVFIDGFTAFMAPEMRFIERMLFEHAEVTVTACCPGLHECGPLSVFAPVGDTVRKLAAAARRAGSAVAAPLVLEGPRRARDGALRALALRYLRDSTPYGAEQDDVRIIAAGDVFDEVEYIAREINALVFDHGYRYREIAVITRDLAPYADAFEDIFSRYGIPFNFDRRENVEELELINLILSALLAVKGGFDTSQLISLAKLPLLGIAEEDAFELENYCFVWDVRGRLWQNPFCNSPDGLRETLSGAARARLERVEKARQTLIGPLASLRDALAEPSGESFARGVYGYLIDTGAVERLRDQCAVGAAREYVDIQSPLYDGVIDILDLFYRILGTQRVAKARLIELFRLAAQSCDVGKLPQTLDQVLIGTADRVRPVGVRAAFVCGAVEGGFPPHFSDAGLLSDRERELMKQQGMALNTVKGELVGLERFYTYFAVTIPSQRLYVSYPTRSVGGEGKRPSQIVRAIEGLFPGCAMDASLQDPLRGVTSRGNAFSLLCGLWRGGGALRATLYGTFAGSSDLERLERAVLSVKDKSFTIEDPAIPRLLFGETQLLSPSRLESYYGCAFAYFCEGGLRLKKARRVEFSPLESGSIIHYVLEFMVKKYCLGGVKDISFAALQAEVSALIDDYLSERIEDLSSVDKRFKYLHTRLARMLARLVLRLCAEFSQSEFRPYAFELPIDLESANKPLVLETPGGARACVQGVVDRVDLLEASDGKYLRVVDYKSGARVFNLTDVYYGLNMQMLLYLFTLSQNGDGALRGAVPAGVLYMPAREETLTVERGTPPGEIAALHADGYRMNGLLLDNISVLLRMEENLTGVFIPATLKKDGTLDSKSKVAALEEFGRIRRHIEKLVCGMADSLLAGKVGALPASGLGYDPCGFCDYHMVCRREEQHPVRVLAEMDKRELFETLEREEAGEGEGNG